jgi:DNA-3-methyladenine glycosylase I
MSYCDFAPDHPIHAPYHDTEYGFPCNDDARLNERLALEVMQAGLSWLIVLKKRQAFYKAFRGFAPNKVARFSTREKARLMADEGIIRNAKKSTPSSRTRAACARSPRTTAPSPPGSPRSTRAARMTG